MRPSCRSSSPASSPVRAWPAQTVAARTQSAAVGNSAPLTPEGLRRKVVLIDVWSPPASTRFVPCRISGLESRLRLARPGRGRVHSPVSLASAPRTSTWHSRPWTDLSDRDPQRIRIWRIWTTTRGQRSTLRRPGTARQAMGWRGELRRDGIRDPAAAGGSRPGGSAASCEPGGDSVAKARAALLRWDHRRDIPRAEQRQSGTVTVEGDWQREHQ